MRTPASDLMWTALFKERWYRAQYMAEMELGRYRIRVSRVLNDYRYRLHALAPVQRTMLAGRAAAIVVFDRAMNEVTS